MPRAGDLGDSTRVHPDSVLTLRPIKLAAWLLVVAAALIVLNLCVQVARIWGHDTVFGFGPLLAFTDPQALVHLWIAMLMFGCAGLVGLLTYLRDRRGLSSGYWAGLVVLFAFLGIDEGVGLHDSLSLPVRAAFSHVDLLHAGWVLPYGIALALIALAYLPFLWALTLRTATWLSFAGLLYFGGMIVCAALAGRELLRHGDHWSFAYAALITFGELLKLASIATLAYGLLDYLAREFPDLRLGIARRAHQPAEAKPSPLASPSGNEGA